MRKSRDQSVLANLPKEQVDQLHEWLAVEKIVYAEASNRLLERFGVKAGRTALSKFWKKVCNERLLAEKTFPAAKTGDFQKITIEIFTGATGARINIVAPVNCQVTQASAGNDKEAA